MMKTISQIIQELRKAGFSQARIAQVIGIRQPTVSRWESGQAPNAATAAIKLLQLLKDAGTKPPRE